jgi:RND family efflux transporter MFP subunit
VLAFWLLAGVAGAALAQDAPPVTVVTPVPFEHAETLRFSGTLTAERHAALSPRVSGLVSRVLVDAGDRVAEGDLLLELDATLATLELQRAEAAMDEALTRLDEAQRLRDEGQALGVNMAKTLVRTREAQVVIESAGVARLEADRRTEAEMVARHQLLAPFDGVVSRKRAEIGEWVETGTPVLELLATDRLRLDVQVPQEHFANVALDMPVSVRLDPFPDQAIVGRVAAKVPLSDPGVRTFLVRILLANPNGDMIAGMSAVAGFGLEGDRVALGLPRDVLKRYPDGTTTVWVVERAGGDAKVSERKVRIGRAIAETVDVIEGLEPDALVVLDGNETLQEGQAVRVVDEAAMR